MELFTRTLGDGSGWEMVTSPFTAHGNTVPAGFVFDGASVPRIFWPLLPPFKQTKKAAVMHDYLCRRARTLPDKERSAMARLRADRLFRVMLIEGGVGEVLAFIGYVGVRIGALLGIGGWPPKV